MRKTKFFRFIHVNFSNIKYIGIYTLPCVYVRQKNAKVENSPDTEITKLDKSDR